MRIIALLFGLIVSSGAMAVCEGVSPEQNGIGCKVEYIDGLGKTLLIRIHARKGDSVQRIGAAKAATRQAIDSFILSGGTFIKMRTTRADGVEVERTCSKIKGKKTEHCGEWAPV